MIYVTTHRCRAHNFSGGNVYIPSTLSRDSMGSRRRSTKPQSTQRDVALSTLCAGCRKESRCAFAYLDWLTASETAPAAGTPSVITKSYQPGEYVVHQGEPWTHLLVVCRGLAFTTTVTEGGDEVGLQSICVGGIIGLADWLAGRKVFSVAARVLMETTIAYVRPDDFMLRLKMDESRLSLLLRQIGYQANSLEDRIRGQALHDACGRVVHCLLQLVKGMNPTANKQVVLPVRIPRTLLAQCVGLNPETVSRMLMRLQRQRLITRSDHRITIPDLAKLQRVLNGNGDKAP